MILVFGSINIDLAFAVDRTPAPGETVLCPSYLMNPGGKGANQAVAAARAGARVAMAGCVGRDAFAVPALATLRDAGIDLSRVKEADAPTACAAIWVDSGGENAIVVASGANLDVRAAQVPDSMLGPDTLVLLQMEVPFEENWALAARARARGARIALNVAPAAPVPTEVLDALDLLIVNEIEGAAIAAAEGLAASTPKDLPRLLAERHDLTCALTLGAEGVVLHGPEGGFVVPALPLSPVDTTGAGDTFTGVMAAGLDAGLSMGDAARRASVAAGLTCLKPGAQAAIPHRAEIDSALPRLP
jgi:ribokinase